MGSNINAKMFGTLLWFARGSFQVGAVWGLTNIYTNVDIYFYVVIFLMFKHVKVALSRINDGFKGC